MDVAYPAVNADVHPLTGRRVPDLPSEDGSVFDHLTGGRALLLSFVGPGALPSGTEFAATRGILVRPARLWPGQDKVAAVLVRPDGYVAWASDEAADEGAIAAIAGFGVTFAA